MRLVLIVILVVLVLVPVGIWLSARAALDPSRAHSKATSALPLFDAATPASGLVRIAAGGFEFRARIAGFDRAGPTLILLHGFPETSIMWEPLIARAASEGFRVVAFDQRGYSPGARPEGVASYAVPRLVEDVLAVADAVGADRFHLVGHDWGAVAGWITAATSPDRVVSWTALSIPHPSSLPDPATPEATPAYIHVFRVPGLAENLLGAGGRRLMYVLSGGDFSEAQHEEYDAVFAEPGALSATLNWYRAMNPANPPEVFARSVSNPVLYVYGRNDVSAFVNDDVQKRLEAFVSGPFERIPLEAGHWLIEDEESVVVDAVMAHLDRYR